MSSAKDSPKVKGLIDELVKSISSNFKIQIPVGAVHGSVRKFYNEGLEEMEEQFDMNFLPNEERITLLNDYIIGNIKDMNEEMEGKVRKVITQGIFNNESLDKMSENIRDISMIAQNRAKVIARTELNRAFNLSHLDAANQTGLKLEKEWVAHIDSTTSPICKALNGVRVGVNEKFVWKNQEFEAPPAHPNCRSRVIFIEEGMEDDE